jgi:hypothetical protein
MLNEIQIIQHSTFTTQHFGFASHQKMAAGQPDRRPA